MIKRGELPTALNALVFDVSMRLQDIGYKLFRGPLSITLYLMSRAAWLMGLADRSDQLLLSASRLSDSEWFVATINRRLPELVEGLPALSGTMVPADEMKRRCLIVATPKMEGARCVRKGVLVATFTSSIGSLYKTVGASGGLDQYHVLLEPSWSGVADPDILMWAGLGEPVLVQTPEQRDFEMLSRLDTCLHPVRIGPGDWVNPEGFRPLGIEKVYDAITVGNYGWYKRIHAYLRAIKEAAARREGFRAALVLARWGGNRQQQIRSWIAANDLDEVITLFEGVGKTELNKLLNESRVCLLTSWKEGGNRAIFEAMFADTPVIILRSNVGVDKTAVNEQTGVITSDDRLADAILEVVDQQWRFRPRKWCMENIGPVHCTRKLAVILGELFPDEAWSEEEICAKVNAPEICYFDPGKARALIDPDATDGVFGRSDAFKKP